MGLPTVTQTWTISANNRYYFMEGAGTVLGCMQAYLFAMKGFLKATMGYTVKGSSSAGVAAMDGVDRWTSAADVTPRGANTTSSQAWVVLTDGNGCDVLIAFMGGSDDRASFGYSATGAFAAAGTATNTPTASDRAIVSDGTGATSVINATASSDRVFHFWGSSDKKMFRATIYRQNALLSTWGIEKITSAVVSPTTFSPATWIFAGVSGGANDYTRPTAFNGSALSDGIAPLNSGGGGFARVNGSLTITVGGGGRAWGPVGGQNGSNLASRFPELQGGKGFPIFPVTCTSGTALGRGKLGTRIDWWFVFTNSMTTLPAHGDVFGGLRFVAIGNFLWPWDGVNPPLTA